MGTEICIWGLLFHSYILSCHSAFRAGQSKSLRAFLYSIALIQHFASQFCGAQLSTHKSTAAFCKAEKPYRSLLVKGQGETIRPSMLIHFWTKVLKITTTIYSVKLPDKHFRFGHHRRRQINVLIVKMRKQLEKVKECVSKVTSNDVPELVLTLAGEPSSTGSVRRQHSPMPCHPGVQGIPIGTFLCPFHCFVASVSSYS